MPRRARKLQFGEYYHVMNRGSGRALIFHTASDYQAFVRLLAETVERFELPLLAYCLMPNHWHLVARPESHSQLSKSMHWLTMTHAVRWCRTHERTGPGPLYQGRFKAVPVESGWHLVRACRYVERNASRRNLAARAEQWPWGSANQRVQKRDRPRLLPLQYVTPEDWLQMLNDPGPDADVADAFRRNRPFASDAWIRARLAACGLPELRKPGRPVRTNN